MKEIFTMDLKGKLLIAVVFMVLGFMLSVQYKTTELQRNVRMDRVEDLSERLKIMEAENKQLLTELETLRAGAAKDPADDRMKLMAGTTLSSALRLRGGVVETFEFWGIQVKIKTVEKLHIPALKAPRSFEYAKIVESKEAAK